MEQIGFVYSLIDNGRVFYIGCTTDLSKRYAQHCTVQAKSKTYLYIQNMLLKGRLPDIKLIACLEIGAAYAKEAQLIIAFRESGHKLINEVRNSTINTLDVLINDFKIKPFIPPSILDRIIQNQENAISHYNRFQCR